MRQIGIDCNCISIDHYRKQSWSVNFDTPGNSINQSTHKRTQSSCTVPDIYSPALNKLEFSPRVLVKQSDIKFHENPQAGIEIFSCGQTDRHDETVTFRNFANAPSSMCCVCPQPRTLHFSWSRKLLFYQRDCFPRPYSTKCNLKSCSVRAQCWQCAACMQEATYEGQPSDTITLISSSINLIELVGG